MRRVLLIIVLLFGCAVESVPAQEVTDIPNQVKIHRNVTTDTGSSEAAADLLRVIQHYNAVTPNPYDFRGNPVHIRMIYGNNTPAVGTVGGLAVQTHIYQSGNMQSEWNSLFLDVSDDSPVNSGRTWGVDASVFGPVTTQANILQGAVWFQGNYNPAPIANGGFGVSVVSLPGGGGGDAATDRSTRQTYPIDVGFAVSGWSGTRDQSINTPAYRTAIQIGGWASGWMAKYMKSTMGTGLIFADIFMGDGIDMSKAQITGSPIKFPANFAGGGNRVLCVNNDGGIFPSAAGQPCVDESIVDTLPAKGFLDGVSASTCSAFGWAVDPDARNTHVGVKIYSDAVLVATVVASQPRPDLAAANECPGGACAFSVQLGLSVGSHNITATAIDVQTSVEHPLWASPKTLVCH